jgi:hypothetical protein
MQKFLYNEFRLTDKTMKLNVNVVLGFQNVIAILISFVSKNINDDLLFSLEVQLHITN